MIRRLVRNRAFQFAAVLAVVIAGRILPDASPAERDPRPAPHVFRPADPGPESTDPVAVAVRILQEHARFPAMEPEAVADAVRSFSTATDGERLAAGILRQLERLRAGYAGGGTRFWVGPLGVERRPSAPDREQVDVWFSRVVVAPDTPIYAEWRIARVVLARENESWRLAEYEDVAGPRPEGRPAQAEPAATPSVLERYEAIDR